MEASDTILSDITLKKLIWCRHVEGIDRMGLQEIMTHWKREGRRKRGSPRNTGKDGIYRAVRGRWDIYSGEWKVGYIQR
jgi:hypothetical protein